VDDLHAAAAATGGCLDDDREADLLGYLDRLVDVVHPFLGPRQDRHADLDDRLAGADLVPHDAHALGGGSDEGDAALLADLCKVGVLGEEAVAWMNRLGVGQLGGRDDGIDIEVAGEARRGTDADALVGKPDMERFAVGGGVDGDRLDPHLFAGPDDPDRDLAPVGDEYFMEHV
jgi:hypothetical protein